MGSAEEEHAGGALVFPSFSLGDHFQVNSRRHNGEPLRMSAGTTRHGWRSTRKGTVSTSSSRIFSTFRKTPMPTCARNLITWPNGDQTESIPLLPDRVYMAPSGYKLRMQKHPDRTDLAIGRHGR